MVSVRYPGAELEREGRRRWLEWIRPSCGCVGPPRCQPRSLRTRGALLGPQSPPSGRVGGGAGSQDPGRPVQSLRAPTSAPTPQPRVLPRLCCDPRGGLSGDPRDSVYVVRAWEELWCVGSPVPDFFPGVTRFLLFSSYLSTKSVSSLRPCPLKLSSS